MSFDSRHVGALPTASAQARLQLLLTAAPPGIAGRDDASLLERAQVLWSAAGFTADARALCGTSPRLRR